ncbi:hypothetical protein HZS_3556 [Henneguya salminicola]|nr:hypothetical protein HZS_3556 [Henneguya salminicola]
MVENHKHYQKPTYEKIESIIYAVEKHEKSSSKKEEWGLKNEEMKSNLNFHTKNPTILEWVDADCLLTLPQLYEQIFNSY